MESCECKGFQIPPHIFHSFSNKNSFRFNYPKEDTGTQGSKIEKKYMQFFPNEFPGQCRNRPGLSLGKQKKLLEN